MTDEYNDDLNDVRQQLQDSGLYSPAVVSQMDAFRASVHEQLIALRIDPSAENLEFELTWMVAGGVVAQLLASNQTMDMLADVLHGDKRGAMAAHLFWSAGISPHPSEKLPG